MPSPEVTILVSLGGSVLVAAAPKLLDFFFGARIARRKESEDRKTAEEAYRLRVFEDAAQARTDRAEMIAQQRQRIKELEEDLDNSRHGGTAPRGM